MTVWKWSTTPGSNDSADSSINYRENQAPSTLNNSARATMAALKKWWLDSGGILETSGTDTAYAITTNQNISVLTDGASVSARLHVTNGESPTLSVDGTDAKPITIAPGVPPSASMLLAGTMQTFTRIAADDEWRLKHVIIPDGVAKTGAKMDTILPGPYAGWVLAAGKTIGNAASGGTERAHADTRPLYIGWHKATVAQNALYPIQDSSGNATTRATGGTADENALADFNANKRLPLPSLRGRSFAGLDNLGGTPADVVTNAAADILGGTVGAEKHTLQTSEIPSHNHGVNDPSHGHPGSTAGNVVSANFSGASFNSPGTRGVGTIGLNIANSATGITVQYAGGGGAHNNMQPTFFGYVWIKL